MQVTNEYALKNYSATDHIFLNMENPLGCSHLRSIGLVPLELINARELTGKPTPFILEILKKAFSISQAIVVLMTPDDVGCLRKLFREKEEPIHEIQFTTQARQNVVFEAGLALGIHPNRTILVTLGHTRPYTDIGGLHLIKLDNTVEKRKMLADSLFKAKCIVDLSGDNWRTKEKGGDFEGALTTYDGDYNKELLSLVVAEKERLESSQIVGSKMIIVESDYERRMINLQTAPVPKTRSPEIHFVVTQLQSNGVKRILPSVGFNLRNLSDEQLKLQVVADVFLDGRYLGHPSAWSGYYSGKTIWNFNALGGLRDGNFTVPITKVEKGQRLVIIISVTAVDEKDQEHELLPQGWVYMPEANDWFYDPGVEDLKKLEKEHTDHCKSTEKANKPGTHFYLKPDAYGGIATDCDCWCHKK
jgi:hypothetical protein